MDKTTLDAHGGILSDQQWGEVRECLSIMIDALGDEPKQFTRDYLTNLVIHQNIMVGITVPAVIAANRKIPGGNLAPASRSFPKR